MSEKEAQGFTLELENAAGVHQYENIKADTRNHDQWQLVYSAKQTF